MGKTYRDKGGPEKELPKGSGRPAIPMYGKRSIAALFAAQEDKRIAKRKLWAKN